MNRSKEPLYRKYNKLARGFRHSSYGGDFRHERNSKELKNFEGSHLSIKRTREGFDYTPLFKFLLSRVGQDWDTVFSEAVSRLDKKEPVFWIVDMHYEPGDFGTVRTDESSYFSKLTVQNGLLVLADPEAEPPAINCTCCTHTFNGKPY